MLLKLSYEKKEVTLASGKKSDFYFDGKQTSLNPEGAHLCGELILEMIRSDFPEIEAVGGPTLGADPLVLAVAYASFSQKPLPAFIIRKEPKGHGTGAWIEGMKNLRMGMPVVILEDVVTTGGSSLTAVAKALEAGLKVAGVIALVDREDGGRGTIEGKGYKFRSIFTKTELLS
ncbi:MAG: orotate phosphoribosyltransferase [Deltaproteobacteria bacterium]|nr:orotate phosphoribosyltransferase [Deltaproteobacteria bacterium]